MKRERPGGFELDDDPARVDVEAVHRFLAAESYWARGRARETVERLVRETVDGSPFAGRKWLLHTADAHALYARLGFGPPSERVLERQ